jgi:hypothetical protein
VSKVPTLILGMDVSHGSPGQSDIPSIAAVIKFHTVCAFEDMSLWVHRYLHVFYLSHINV